MHHIISLLAFLCFISVAAAHPEIPISASVPKIDGRLEETEWKDAKTFPLKPHGTLFLKRSTDSLYVGIKSMGKGIGSLCIPHDKQVEILHASAALGTAVFEKKGDDWISVKEFSWCCRATTLDESAEADLNKFYSESGWIANNNNMGDTGVVEYKISLQKYDQSGFALGVVYMEMEPNEILVSLPEIGADGCTNSRLAKGFTDFHPQFNQNNWLRITVQP